MAYPHIAHDLLEDEFAPPNAPPRSAKADNGTNSRREGNMSEGVERGWRTIPGVRLPQESRMATAGYMFVGKCVCIMEPG